MNNFGAANLDAAIEHLHVGLSLSPAGSRASLFNPAGTDSIVHF